jgi:hypothetical protein
MYFVHINRKILTLIGFISLSILCIAFPKTQVLVPKNARSPIVINISDKSLKYYPISVEEAMILSARGPGKLKIITRGHLGSKSNKTLNYVVYYRINGGEKIKSNFNSVKVDQKAYFEDDSKGFPSVSEKIIIELSRGENTVEVWSASGNPKICIRSLFTKIKEKKIDWVRLSTMYPNIPVSLIANEDVLSYFRYSPSKSLKIKITGPTVLRVLNRFEFDYKMKGKINYRIEVKEDKKVKNTYMLCSTRSDVTRYRNDGKRIPGKANEIVINVPSGTHKYELIPLDNYTILARILFPKKDIKLDEY